jgi:hypothetical protein
MFCIARHGNSFSPPKGSFFHGGWKCRQVEALNGKEVQPMGLNKIATWNVTPISSK